MPFDIGYYVCLQLSLCNANHFSYRCSSMHLLQTCLIFFSSPTKTAPIKYMRGAEVVGVSECPPHKSCNVFSILSMV